MKKYWWIFLLIFIVGFFLIKPEEKNSITCDLDGDGFEETVRLHSVLGKDFISVFKNNSEIVKKDITELDPKSMQICEIDGREPKEIFISVKKSTLMHKEVIERPFFLQFDGEKLIRKWTGSTFGEEYKKVYFFDLNNDGKDEVYSVELPKDGKERVSVYYWLLFGFIKNRESIEYEKINSLRFKDNELMIDFNQDNKRIEREIQWKDEKADNII